MEPLVAEPDGDGFLLLCWTELQLGPLHLTPSYLTSSAKPIDFSFDTTVQIHIPQIKIFHATLPCPIMCLKLNSLRSRPSEPPHPLFLLLPNRHPGHTKAILGPWRYYAASYCVSWLSASPPLISLWNTISGVLSSAQPPGGPVQDQTHPGWCQHCAELHVSPLPVSLLSHEYPKDRDQVSDLVNKQLSVTVVCQHQARDGTEIQMSRPVCRPCSIRLQWKSAWHTWGKVNDQPQGLVSLYRNMLGDRP